MPIVNTISLIIHILSLGGGFITVPYERLITEKIQALEKGINEMNKI